MWNKALLNAKFEYLTWLVVKRSGNILILLFGLTLFRPFAYGQKIQLTNYYDNENKIIKEIYHVQDSILNGQYLGYYRSGQIKVKGQYQNNRAVGVWQYFYENGSLKMKGELKNNSNYGPWEYYYDNGKKSMEGKILNGLRQGFWKFYYPSGKLKSEGLFVNNFRTGEWKYYYEDGGKLGTGNYKRGRGLYTEFYPNGNKYMEGVREGGKNQGNWSVYYEDGKLQALGDFMNGKKDGFWQYFYENGMVQSEGYYKSDQQSGEWSYYSEEGALTSKGKLVGGLKDGFWSIYDESGRLKGEGNFDKGEGIYKELYTDGSVKVEGKIVNNLKSGKWSFYYQTGELEGECIYVKGKGKYVGYYKDGKKKMAGNMDDDIMVGIWELYETDGSLAGYYTPYYDDKGPVFELQTDVSGNRSTSDSKARRLSEFRFKKRKFTPFKPKLNEFKAIIFSYNPFAVVFGNLPFGVEYYIQDRLGHELLFNLRRNPFFKQDSRIDLDEVYNRGYDFSIRQKYYLPNTKLGIIYIGQELRFSNYSYRANTIDPVDPSITVILRKDERKYEYSLLLGKRLVKEINSNGITADFFVGIGTGYRTMSQNFTSTTQTETIFRKVNTGKVPLSFRAGINFGYIFGFKR